ncbi:hypothetical protein IMCC14465_16560 [alpha proteobacterium IMCC14465]|uniref:Uncharacterized protein n=1 Tax=alpha proteobacterium IMCC14465 TaxID=1220535 RepID=J9DF91_9PROT|nr:hypothetical protein IMCC14465_16560 [alpha proteobacterium IMCC14465]
MASFAAYFDPSKIPLTASQTQTQIIKRNSAVLKSQSAC